MSYRYWPLFKRFVLINIHQEMRQEQPQDRPAKQKQTTTAVVFVLFHLGKNMDQVRKKSGKDKLTHEVLREHSEAFLNMVTWQRYEDRDPVLLELRQDAQRQMHAYNKSDPMQPEERDKMIRELLGSTGESVLVEPPFYVDYGLNIFVGENFYCNFGCCILDGGIVKIGKNVMFAPGVQIYTAHHPLDGKARHEGWELCNQVTIGDYVWVGGNAIINPGVTIGSNAVIGSGSVVTKDVPANCVVAGNPAKIIRRLDGDATTRDYIERRQARRVCDVYRPAASASPSSWLNASLPVVLTCALVCVIVGVRLRF